MTCRYLDEDVAHCRQWLQAAMRERAERARCAHHEARLRDSVPVLLPSSVAEMVEEMLGELQDRRRDLPVDSESPAWHVTLDPPDWVRAPLEAGRDYVVQALERGRGLDESWAPGTVWPVRWVRVSLPGLFYPQGGAPHVYVREPATPGQAAQRLPPEVGHSEGGDGMA